MELETSDKGAQLSSPCFIREQHRVNISEGPEHFCRFFVKECLTEVTTETAP